MPVAPDLAKTVKVGSDHSKNLTSVFYGAKNEKLRGILWGIFFHRFRIAVNAEP